MKRHIISATALSTVLVLAACGSDDEGADRADPPAESTATASDDTRAPADTSSTPDETTQAPVTITVDSGAPAESTPIADTTPTAETAGTAPTGESGQATDGDVCALITVDEAVAATGAASYTSSATDLAGAGLCNFAGATLEDPILTVTSVTIPDGGPGWDTIRDQYTSALGQGTTEDLDIGDEGFIYTGEIAGTSTAAAGFRVGDAFVSITITNVAGDAAAARTAAEDLAAIAVDRV